MLPKKPISDAAKQIIRERANYLCEYCHSPERLSANRFTIDRIIPKSLGGSDEIDNLALACRRCNERRYNESGWRRSRNPGNCPDFQSASAKVGRTFRLGR
ncbi:MAG TPA: HNH endonuclease signature motif containing protein [Allocoleopsis sp.]